MYQNNLIETKQKWLLYLESQFGSYSLGDLVDDLGVKAATVVHVPHHDWKTLDQKEQWIHITVHTLGEYEPPTHAIHRNFAAAYLCWTHLLGSDVRRTKPVG